VQYEEQTFDFIQLSQILVRYTSLIPCSDIRVCVTSAKLESEPRTSWVTVDYRLLE